MKIKLSSILFLYFVIAVFLLLRNHRQNQESRQLASFRKNLGVPVLKRIVLGERLKRQIHKKSRMWDHYTDNSEKRFCDLEKLLSFRALERALNEKNYLLAVGILKTFANYFQLPKEINVSEFRLSDSNQFVMMTRRYFKEFKRFYIIDISPDELEKGLPGIRLVAVQNFRSTVLHELRHIRQFEKNVHFSHYSDEMKRYFWVEQERESNPKMNSKGGLNSRVEADAYLFQLLAGQLSPDYQRLVLNRLRYWYRPVVHPDSNLRRDLDSIIALF